METNPNQVVEQAYEKALEQTSEEVRENVTQEHTDLVKGIMEIYAGVSAYLRENAIYHIRTPMENSEMLNRTLGFILDMSKNPETGKIPLEDRYAFEHLVTLLSYVPEVLACLNIQTLVSEPAGDFEQLTIRNRFLIPFLQESPKKIQYANSSVVKLAGFEDYFAEITHIDEVADRVKKSIEEIDILFPEIQGQMLKVSCEHFLANWILPTLRIIEGLENIDLYDTYNPTIRLPLFASQYRQWESKMEKDFKEGKCTRYLSFIYNEDQGTITFIDGRTQIKEVMERETNPQEFEQVKNTLYHITGHTGVGVKISSEEDPARLNRIKVTLPIEYQVHWDFLKANVEIFVHNSERGATVKLNEISLS